MSRPERMRAADAAWLGMSRPQNRMVVTGVLRLAGRIEVDDLRDLVHRRMVLAHPRLRQVPRGAGRPRWHQDLAFDLSHHVQDLTADGPHDDSGLARAAGELCSRPLAEGRPAWQLHLLAREDGGSALVARFHHSLGDGAALATVLLHLTDPVAPAAPVASGPAAVASPAPRPRGRRRPGPARALLSALTTVVRLLLALGEPPTLLRDPLGTRKVLALTRPHDLDEVRSIAREHGVSINDVLLAATAGGLRRHLLEQGGAVADLRALVPVDLRGGRPVPATLGNLFGVVVLTLPVGHEDRGDRLRDVAAGAARLTASAEPAGTYLLLRAVGALPRLVRALAVKVLEESASVVVTNVPGPRDALVLAGCRIEDVAFWAPTVGRVGLGVSLFSYAGTVTVGVAADARLGVDAARLAAAISAEIGP